MFDYFFTMRHKRKLTELIDIVNQTPLMHVSGMLGRERHYTSWIVPIAWHPTNQNAVIVVDLGKDLSRCWSSMPKRCKRVSIRGMKT